MSGVQRIVPCMTCHAWNGDRTKVAICPNTKDVQIYRKNGPNYELEATLKEHDSVVTSIDWAPRTNKILTCSQDRNANVWEFIDGRWQPHLVLLRINRAATHCKWSLDEKKFAVASGAKVVSICSYDSDENWWTSKHVKHHRSTITHVAWHPNGALIATASTDYKCRIISVPIRGIDRPDGGNWIQKAPNFGEEVFVFDCNAWVHSCAFSPSGDILAFCGQDSTIHFVWANGGQEPQVQVIKLNKLPLLDLMFVDEQTVVAAGHDCQPFVFKCGQNGFELSRSLDDGNSGAPAPSGPAKNSAFAMFQNTVNKGTTDARTTNTTLKTRHQNSINCIQPLSSGGRISDFSTSGLDGAIAMWKV